MGLYTMLTAVLVLSGMALVTLTIVSTSKLAIGHHIREGRRHSLSEREFWRLALPNALLSLALVYGFTYAFERLLFHSASVTVMRVISESTAILGLFDFLYYLVHRYPFHEWTLLRRVHAVHHVIRNPSAIDSLYQHPLENLIGLALLWVCTGAVRLAFGEVSIYSFGTVFLVYSLLNILVHANLRVSVPLVTHLASRHNQHHAHMRAKNYASVTPLFDILFGTEEPTPAGKNGN